MQGKERNQRRSFLKAAAGSGLAVLTGSTRAQSFPFAPNQRYPDPAILILDPSFAKYRPYSSTVEQVGTGMRGADGPVYFPNPVAGKPGYLLCSDIPNNRLMKFDEASNKFTIHKEDVNFVNGNTRDRQGRLISCEHSVTRRITRTEKNGKITVLADRFDDKRLNAPHDIVVKSDDSIWFTDPIFGISGEWEGYRAKSEQATTNVYRLTKDAKITAVITGLVNPTGIAFSPDEKKLYVVESRGTPSRSIWSFDVNEDASVSSKVKLVDANGPGAIDGLRVDRDGNLWCGWGHSGAFAAEASNVGGAMRAHMPTAKSENFDGVKVFNKDGKAIGFIQLPERCANLEFGGPKRNRLYMASSHSLYAVYLETQGAI